MTKQRLWQLDALRGLALLNMLAYHAMYDWVYVFGIVKNRAVQIQAD